MGEGLDCGNSYTSNMISDRMSHIAWIVSHHDKSSNPLWNWIVSFTNIAFVSHFSLSDNPLKMEINVYCETVHYVQAGFALLCI